MLEEFLTQYATAFPHSRADTGWCYEDGCVYRGLLELHRASGNPDWRAHLDRLIAHQVREDGTILGYSPNEYNIDHILSGRVLFEMTQKRGDRFDIALDLLARQLAKHPRTQSGSYWHKNIYPNQVWLDGLYMGLPFQIEYGLVRNRLDMVIDATDQILRALASMRDAATGLYYHGHDHSKQADWSDPETGLSKSLWARAIGWLAMALIDSYDLLPAEHAAREKIGRHTTTLLDAVLKHRTVNGLWLQVIDQPDLAGNYEETSSSSMFAYALLKTARLVDARFRQDGLDALDALVRHHVAKTDGVWQLDNVCQVAGLGNPFGKTRDGTPGYYVSEPVVANDPKAVGPLMMAYAEKLLAQDSSDRSTEKQSAAVSG